MDKIFINLLLLIACGYFIQAQLPSGLSPNNGPTTGNTSIIINGTSLSNITTCSFNNSQVSATYNNITHTITCIAPAGVMGTVFVTLTNNIGANFTVPGTFIYQDITLLNVSPDNGAQAGGDQILVSGSGFLNTSYLACLFANKSAVAIFISVNQIICITPTGNQPESDLIYVSNNGYNFITTGVNFIYQDIFAVSLSPTVGSVAGGTNITIFASSFLNRTTLSCEFNATIVNATYINYSTIQCVAPGNIVSSGQSVLVRASNNGLDYYNLFNYAYQDIVGPFTALSNNGFTTPGLISISGNGFYNSSTLVCKVGGIIFSATFINSSFIYCTVPRVTGNQSVYISNNGQEFQLIEFIIFTTAASSSKHQSSNQKQMIPITATIGFLVGVPVGAAVGLSLIIAIPCIFYFRAKQNKKKKVIKPLPPDPDDKIYKSSNF